MAFVLVISLYLRLNFFEMLTLQQIKNNTAAVIDKLNKRGIDSNSLINKAIELDESRRNIQQQADTAASEMNSISKQIGKLMAAGDKEGAEAAKAKTSTLKATAKELAEQLQEAETNLTDLLLTIPNVPHERVPNGTNENDNEVVKEVGEKPTLGIANSPHWNLGQKYNLFDLELGVKITGAGFPVYRGKGAKLQRALINFFLDEAIKAGYEEIQSPLMVNTDSAKGTGQLPDKDGQMYHVTGDDLYLIPTAEVPLTNLYRDVILNEKDLSVKNCGYTPCFRREAGSYGAHVRGLNRLHQFDKVEIVQITEPEKSYEVHAEMVGYVESLLQKLELPYRILNLCGGDLTFASALTYDMEVWSAAQQRWLEVSSVSNFETYQSNRMKLRYKNADNKKQLAHTLNGSAIALPRIVAALLENNQTTEGIRIPEALHSYTGFEVID